MHNKICLNSNTYHGFPLSEALKGAQEAGIRYLEIAAVEGHTEHVNSRMSDAEVRAVLSELRRHDIQVLSVGGHSNLMTSAGRSQFSDNIRLAARLGAAYVVTGTGETHGDHEVIDDEAEFVESLKGLVAEAAQLGISIALETHGNNYGTGGQINRLVEKLGAENFGINYDTGNVIFYADTEPYEDLERSAHNVTGIHLKDKAGAPSEWNFPAIGDGNVDFARVFDILTRTRCAAPLSIEIEFTPDGPSSVEEVHRALVRSVATIHHLQLARP